ncbi:DUF1049 domain-containing protein [Alicyclobacillus sp. TC]|uniref:LapA family protein n=1 Tax=Alicyclobacillus sp. TC TaxID=2606450 RepID=UPI001933486E|nr:lipopolysaccharide assembly protein LapA domain-containing protein [Alicyclobacillus sp. TC]QRF24501.1 DUF1049 domain-containing protein [Alicyclobacillus sp. TC]
MKIQGRLILALLFAVIVAIFAVINVHQEPINFLFATAYVPLVLIILGSAAAGGIIVGSFGLVSQLRLRRKCSQLENELSERTARMEELEQQLSPDTGHLDLGQSDSSVRTDL